MALWRPEPGPLDIYRALRHGGGLEPPAGLNVCHECDTVFRSQQARASKCSRCHRSPRPLPELRPWHLASYAQETFDTDTGEPAGWSVGYAATCQGCGARFDSTDARQRYCANCGGGAGRKRRHRGSDSRRGRQRFRFEGPPNLTGLSVALPDGSSAELTIEGRIVETSDAEAAKALDHFPSLRRL